MIKYRVWIEKDKRYYRVQCMEWERGNALFVRYEKNQHEYATCHTRRDGTNPFGGVLEAYTGRNDLNGLEIFAGDWVEYCVGSLLMRDIVRWENCGWFPMTLTPSGMEFEIVGNIHEEAK